MSAPEATSELWDGVERRTIDLGPPEGVEERRTANLQLVQTLEPLTEAALAEIIILNPPDRHEAAVESYRLGDIVGTAGLSPEAVGIDQALAPASITAVEVSDPYVQQWAPEIRKKVATEEARADAHARTRRQLGYWERRPNTAYYGEDEAGDMAASTKRIWGDPVARSEYFERLDSPSSLAWSRLIPSARALSYLSDPNRHEYIINNKGKQLAAIDETTRQWLSLCTDAVGIRARATVMADIVKGFVEEQNPTAEQPGSVRWLSVACGTALPSMKGAINAGIAPELILADFDDSAMEATSELATEIGFAGTIQKNHVNIFDAQEMAAFRERLQANGGLPHLIDAMGIFEYTGENLGVDPADFLRGLYDMLAPGGKLVFGQMRRDRQNADFTMGVIGWPYVEMRVPAELMQVIDKAGIPVEQAELYLPTDDTYTVAAVNKPA